MLKEKKEIPITNCDYWLNVSKAYHKVDEELCKFLDSEEKPKILGDARRLLAKSFGKAEEFFEKG